MKPYGLRLLLIILILATACNNPDSSGYPVKTGIKDGVAYTSSPNYPKNGTKHFSLKEILSIGHDGDENYIFVRPVKICTDRQGNIFILELNKCMVQMFDQSGAFVRNFGKRGRGPSEFTFPIDMFVDDRNRVLHILGNENRKISRYSLDGQLKDEVKINAASPGLFYLDHAGNYLIQTSSTDNDNNQKIKWQKYSHDGGQMKESIEFFAAKRKAKHYGNTVISGATPFDPVSHFLFGRDGSLFYAFSDDFKIYLYDRLFHKKKVFSKREHLAVKIPDKEKKRFIDYLKRRQKKRGISFHIKDFSLPGVYPAFLSMWLGDDGHILVRIPSNDEKIHVDRFSPEGVYLEKMIFNPPPGGVSLKYIFHRPLFRNGCIYSIVMDKNGHWAIKKYRIMPKVGNQSL